MDDDDDPLHQFKYNSTDGLRGLDLGNLRPEYIEYTDIFPEYPKTHVRGFVTAITLPEAILHDEARVKALKTAMQYTLTHVGVGFRDKKNIAFFGLNDEEGITMQYARRRCAGCKICTKFPPELRVPHTHVDFDEGNLVTRIYLANYTGILWSKLLAEQKIKEANKATARADALYSQYKNSTCSRMDRHGDICGGHTVLRSYSAAADSFGEQHSRIFVGCSRWQYGEESHFHQKIKNYDPITLPKSWGGDRCTVHADILHELGFRWEDVNRPQDLGTV